LLLYCVLLSRYYLIDALSLFIVDVGFIYLFEERSNQTIQKKKNIKMNLKDFFYFQKILYPTIIYSSIFITVLK